MRARASVLAMFTLTIRLNDVTGSPAHLLATAVDEAKAVWRSNGVVLEMTTRTDACVAATIVGQPLRGADQAKRMASSSEVLGLKLGAIEFGSDGHPHNIQVSMSSIDALLFDSRSTLHLDARPPAVRELFVGRTVGRVLAHEIGHFLLRYPAHLGPGLMAAQHTSDDFVAADRSAFRLTRMLENRLQEALRSNSSCPPTSRDVH